MRKNLIKAIKSNKLNASLLSSSWKTEYKIYINERLTKDKRIRYSKAWVAAKKKLKKFI